MAGGYEGLYTQNHHYNYDIEVKSPHRGNHRQTDRENVLSLIDSLTKYDQIVHQSIDMILVT